MVSQRWIHVGLVVAALLPFFGLIQGALRDTLGANPIETITHTTGEWALRLLLATLAVTPLRRLFGWRRLAPYRRTLGLLAFSYVCLHFATYVVLDLSFDLAAVGEDIAERPYITAGFSAFLCLLPLALTSTRGWVRRLGRRWVQLHRLVYVAAGLAVIHFLWQVKADLREPLIYAVLLASLLAVRVWFSWNARRARQPAKAAPHRAHRPE